MSGTGDGPNADTLIGFWNFLAGAETDDTGLADGIAQDGQTFGDATVSGGSLFLDGKKDFFTTSGDDRPFDIDEATVQVVFSSESATTGGSSVILNRGEFNDKSKDGYFAIAENGKGGIEILHTNGRTRLDIETHDGLYADGDRVEVTYSFDSAAGGTLTVVNLTTDAREEIAFDKTGLSLATDDKDCENFTFGAREVNQNANTKFFEGELEYVAVLNTANPNGGGVGGPTPPPTQPDGFVDGTAGNDLIDINYTGDPDGDLIDNDDAILPGRVGDDDDVRAGAGNDIVFAANGNDIVDAGSGHDFVTGQSGDDTLFGQEGDDALFGDFENNYFGVGGDDSVDGGLGSDLLSGGSGNDTLEGGQGNDTLLGGRLLDPLFKTSGGADSISGGDDRDFIGLVSAGDTVDGGDGGDDFDTLDLRGSANGGTTRITYTSDDREDGFVTYFDKDGNETGTLEFTEIEKIIPICFTPGTLIATPEGERLIEDLQPGDRVITRDNGIQEICWAGARGVRGAELDANPKLKPVRIAKGALGNGLPEQDMWLSPNHRVLVANDRTALYFEESEVLVAAKHLTALEGIDIVSPRWATYIHVMFEQHEVILSNGSWTESFQPGDYSLKGVGQAQRTEIQTLFPDLQSPAGVSGYHAARRSLKRYEAELLTRS
ncbi:MAG: Hint domain-containing protein [Roseobacter sp.]